MEMEMMMIKKEASKTPAYSPRVESHVAGSNSKCSGCSPLNFLAPRLPAN